MSSKKKPQKHSKATPTSSPMEKSSPEPKQTLFTKILQFISDKAWLFFLLILLLGLYLRFNNIENSLSFWWDQGRDAWVIRDLLQGKLILVGPRTGVGDFHLGPVYYYLLAPFFYFTNLDPMASNYFNILCNIINFVIIFLVSKKLFNSYAALFITLLFATNAYLVGVNKVPWNVTLMPGFSALIFYTIMKVYEGKAKWIIATWTLCGFFFHLHFTAVFFPLIVLASLVFAPHKKQLLKYSLLSIPLYIVWFIPNLVYELQNHSTDYYKMRGFLDTYYHGFHLRFMLHRLSDALLQFGTIINYPPVSYLKYIVPLVFLAVAFLTGKTKERIFAYLISLWFIVPLIGFTVYGGPLSDYYFIYGVPMVLFVIWYLQDKLLKLKFTPVIVVLSLVFWSLYLFTNINQRLDTQEYGGLREQKDSVKEKIKKNEPIPYTEGDIHAYLYTIWTIDGKRF